MYARKACKVRGISPDGIEINCKPVVRQGNLLLPARFMTEVSFPEHFSAEQREAILLEIGRCAVKQ